MTQRRIDLWTGALIALASCCIQSGSAQEKPVANEVQLKRFLARFPEADANQDGVLTQQEAETYRKTRKKGKADEAKDETNSSMPTHANVSYGPYERNKLDFWAAKADRPTPVLIFFHGGSFKAGDKSIVLSRPIFAECLKAGISVASANYRFSTDAPYPAPMLDGARAVQFVRSKSSEWRIDPAHIAASGASAGATLALWIALHDDLADATSTDPIARLSTCVACASPHSGTAGLESSYFRKHAGVAKQGAALWQLFGATSQADFETPAKTALAREASPLSLATREDPPLFLTYQGDPSEAPFAADAAQSNWIHHVCLGLPLKAKYDELGRECEFYYQSKPPAGGAETAFLKRHLLTSAPVSATDQPQRVERFAVHEAAFTAEGRYTNPYVELTAEVVISRPGSASPWRVPLFWDGGTSWKFRFAPDEVGTWTWKVSSRDKGLDGKSGAIDVVTSKRPGSIQPMKGFEHHFQRQDGSPFWFLGDTAWALYTDNAEEKHDRKAALAYVDTRAGQGINVLHSMLLSEAGWGNQGGLPWEDIGGEKLNPGYWQEVDYRLAHANAKGIVCGLALAWGDKRKQEPFAWRRFPSVEARKRYARYVAARYSAYDVYFIVSGEWHGEIRTRPSTEEAVRQEFIEIGDALAAADPHDRMIAIHPMTAQGSVREYNAANWMSFGDYQQNYRDLHGRVLESLKAFNKPVVNAEYGYFLRDQSGDGVPDKDNSTSAEAMRHATWDTVMAGGYAVTGFGTTYFGGNRDPGSFDLDTKKNDVWEAQLGHMRRVFLPLSWWKLRSHDELLSCETPRGKEGKEFNQTVPPAATYWCLADAGRTYVVYYRGLSAPLRLNLDGSQGSLAVMQFNPRNGERKLLAKASGSEPYEIRPPDEQDWVVLLSVVK